MRTVDKLLMRCGIVPLALAAPLAIAQVHFYGVGDLPGGIIQSEVRDTARVGSVLYAVGGVAANAGSIGDDTAFLWTSTGGMTALPPLVAGVVGTTAVIASAITPDGQYIASRARFNSGAPTQRHAVRVTTAGPTNLDLGALPAFPQLSAASAISSDGSVLYGFARYNAASQTQVVRFTAAGPTVTAIPFLNAGDDNSLPAVHGAASSDGSVMVGTSYNSVTVGANAYGPGYAAFRYVEGNGVSAIPFATGGTWNQGLGVTPDGNLALVVGDSTIAPYGEVYIHNATTTALTSLGTPAAGWVPTGGGMNSDGSVVVMASSDPQNPAGGSFVHNASGWHGVQTIVAGAGIDLTGWTLDGVEGISADGTRIWGAGTHNGNQEGFIVEFPARYLAVYGASLPAQSIVGTYSNSDTTMEGASVVVVLANGTYFQIQDAPAGDAPSGVDGFERGTYTWDPVTKALALTTIVDTNGDEGTCPGLCGTPGITATLLGNILSLQIVGPGGGAFSAPMVTGSSPIVGTWVIGDTTLADSSSIVTFFANGTYMQAYDGPADVNHPKGMERGTYTWDSVTGAFTATTLVDTNGTAGLSNPTGSMTVTISGNTLTYTNLGGPGTAYRVIAAPLAPSVAVTMSRKAQGAAGPFDLVTGP